MRIEISVIGGSVSRTNDGDIMIRGIESNGEIIGGKAGLPENVSPGIQISGRTGSPVEFIRVISNKTNNKYVSISNRFTRKIR